MIKTSNCDGTSLGVSPREVGEPADGWLAPDGAVGSVVIVFVDPCWESVSAGRFSVVVPAGGPPVGESAMEPFDLPVGLGSA